MDNTDDSKAQAPKLPRDIYKNDALQFFRNVAPPILKQLNDVKRFSKSPVPHPDSCESVATHIENVMKDFKP